MTVTITFDAVMRVLLYLLGVGIGVILVVVLIKVFKILKKLDKIISDNSADFKDLMTILPVTVKSVNDGLLSAKQTMDSAKDTIGFVSENLATKTFRAFSGAGNIFDILKIVGELALSTIKYFRKDISPKLT